MPGSRFLALGDAAALPGAADPRPRNVLLLADTAHPANVVRDHIGAFLGHSRHAMRVLNPIRDAVDPFLAWREVDAILVHYSIFILGAYYLPAPWARVLRRFHGPKLQIIQDEYRHINDMKLRQADLGFSAVFSSLATDNLPRVYGDHWLRCTRYVSCLPGYVPAYFHALRTPPIAARAFDLVYRGRDLPYWLGRAGQEKRLIGEQLRQAASEHGLRADLDWTEASRVYGDSWIDFLASGRATIAVEGGASIFDFDGCIEDAATAYLEAHPGAAFDEVFERVLRPHEGNVVHRTLTPRILEAIAARTALVLYPGAYRGVLEAGRHYLALERDGRNMAEVVARLRDEAFLQALVDRAHAEILGRRELSMAYYVDGVDAMIASLCAASPLDERTRRAWQHEVAREHGAPPRRPWRRDPEHPFAALPERVPGGALP